MTDVEWSGKKKFKQIHGHRMAYIEEGSGPAIVFAHGNPTSSFLWRNILPACHGLGRLIACDMVGMGDSDKLSNPGPDSYTYAEHCKYLFALWEELALGSEIILVLHDWGSAVGFEWARQNPDRVQGLAFMEAFVMPIEWSDFPEDGRRLFQALRSPAGENLVLTENIFVEKLLPGGVLKQLTDAEMTEYRRPYLRPGEDRFPMLQWPRQIPVEGEPADVTSTVAAYSKWLAESEIPKLYIHTEPGELDRGRRRDFVRTWKNQHEVTVKGRHFVQEDSPVEIGAALSAFVQQLRSDKSRLAH